MASKKKPGNKPGKGRVKGSKNKRTVELEKLINEAAPGWDPVVWMAAMAAHGVDDSLAGKLAAIVATLEGVKGSSPNDSRKINKARGLLADLMLQPKVTKELRVTCAKETAQYIRPKRKAIEVSTDAEEPLTVIVNQNF